ncbi:hypothetical protein HGM15179_019311 [Zosterops borbonicus]|uniref:Uncharacterized protein n=1 Tax=Zosterops borbonicus TaxID=364589 RepID=A0A8K1FY77_9PASS|nr:hypothetical protein HGM15179_019311 [Zosterops borbonicus]
MARAPLGALVALLGLCPGLWPGPGPVLAPRPRPPPAAEPRGELESVIGLARALLGDTKAFLELLASSLLPRLVSDLLRYQRLLEWLRRAGGALRGLDPELGGLRTRLERLRGRLEHLGIDIRHDKDRKVRRKEPKSQDIYLRLLVKVPARRGRFIGTLGKPRGPPTATPSEDRGHLGAKIGILGKI